LPLEQSTTQPNLKRAAWSTRRGLAAALLTPAILLGLIALYIRSTEPTVPPIDIAAEHQRILKEIEQLTPAQWFEEWTYRYRPMTERGFAVYENRLHPIVEHQVTHKRMIQNVLLTIAGALSAIALLAALWPTGNKTRRPGGRETRS
jgi:hypothetical protein